MAEGKSFSSFQVKISDELDLGLIDGSGQCFRMARGEWLGPETWRLVTGTHVLYLRPLSGEDYEGLAPLGEWERVWEPYLDLSFDYGKARRMGERGNAFMKEAFANGKGLRILRQDPWEMLITFILSQRKSIPAIRRNVEDLCRTFGEKIPTPFEEVYAFPKVQSLSGVSEQRLRDLGLGYRAPYVWDAIRQVGSGELNLCRLEELGDEELVEALRSVKGVGLKVASCVALFGYGRKSCAPVDVWIARAIDEECGGADPFGAFAPYEGLSQQYVFHYQMMRKKSKRIEG